MSPLPFLNRMIHLAAPLLLALVVVVSGIAKGGSCGAEHDCCDDEQDDCVAQGEGAVQEGQTHVDGHASDDDRADSEDTAPCDCPDDCATCHCALSVLGKVVSPFAPSIGVPEFERTEPALAWLNAPPEGAQATLFRPPRSAA